MDRDLKQILRLGYADSLLRVTARFWHDGSFEERTEQVIEETPIVFVYNTIPHVVMMATPLNLEDFAVGFSVTEELVRSAADLERIQVVKYGQGIELQLSVPADCEAVIASRTRSLSGRTGCGICGADSIEGVLKTLHQIPPGTTVAPGAIERAFQSLIEHQKLNAAAGTVHAAGWASLDGSILVAREDVGRHNALDKLIGALLRAGTKPDQGFIVVTSRASFEMAQKATAFGAGLLAAISGPTGLAVRVAEQAGLTLVGLARPGRMTIYTHPQRIES